MQDTRKRGKTDALSSSESFSIQSQDLVQNVSSNESLKDPSNISVLREKSDVHVLPRIIAEAFASIIDDTVKKLDLITNVGQLPRLRPDEEESNEDEDLIEGKKKPHEVTGEIHDTVTLERLEDCLERQNVSKFVKNVHFVRNLLQKACISLLEKNSFDLLVDKVTEYKRNIQKRLEISAENLQMKKDIADLVTSFNAEKKKALKEIEKIKGETEKMTNSLGLQMIIENIKINYVHKWERSRNELNTIILTRKENQLNHTIDRMKLEIDREEKVNKEVENYLNEQQQDYEREVQAWIERYDREMEQFDYDISVILERIEEQEISNARLNKMYEERQKFIEDWLVHKEEKRLARERLERITAAALSIQCWWRVVMIKKKLGPYGKKKKGKEKGKKK